MTDNSANKRAAVFDDVPLLGPSSMSRLRELLCVLRFLTGTSAVLCVLAGLGSLLMAIAKTPSIESLSQSYSAAVWFAVSIGSVVVYGLLATIGSLLTLRNPAAQSDRLNLASHPNESRTVIPAVVMVLLPIVGIACCFVVRGISQYVAFDLMPVGSLNISERSPLGYTWTTGTARTIDCGGAESVSFATMRSRDSGAFDLWRVVTADIDHFIARNDLTVVGSTEGTLTAVDHSSISPYFQVNPNPDLIDWWNPPPPSDCECYGWKSADGQIIQTMIVDRDSGAIWID